MYEFSELWNTTRQTNIYIATIFSHANPIRIDKHAFVVQDVDASTTRAIFENRLFSN